MEFYSSFFYQLGQNKTLSKEDVIDVVVKGLDASLATASDKRLGDSSDARWLKDNIVKYIDEGWKFAKCILEIP